MKLSLVTEEIVSECATIVDQILAQEPNLSAYEAWKLAATMQHNRILNQAYVTDTELNPSAFEKIAMELEKIAANLYFMSEADLEA